MRVLSIVSCVSAFVATSALFANPQNPVSRVSALLADLSKKITKDGKAEAKLFKKFQCWCDDVDKKKTGSIAAAKDRISELSVIVDDLTNGRVTLTSEKDDLNEQLVELRASIEEATKNRDAEKAAYQDGLDEFKQAIAALQNTIKVMDQATKPAFLADKSGEAAKALMHRMLVAKFDLRDALRTANGLVSADELRAMEDFIDSQKPLSEQTLDVPKPDWTKMNKNSPAAAKYEMGSSKIQATMKKMLASFEKAMQEADQKEAEGQTTFTNLMEAKHEEEAALVAAMEAGSMESAARAKKLADAKKELSDLQAQLAADEKLLADTRYLCSTKTTEYEERLRLRGEELSSINKAVDVIHSDDARDLFSKSYKAVKGASLLQVRAAAKPAGSAIRAAVVDLLKRTAALAHSPKIAALAMELKYRSSNTTLPEGVTDMSDPFVTVRALVKDRIMALEEQEKSEYEQKKWCLNTTNAEQSKVQKLGHDIDDLTAAIQLSVNIRGEIKADIQGVEADVKAIEESLANANSTRTKEHQLYLATVKDDNDALDLLEQAMALLKHFYESNKLEAAFIATASRPLYRFRRPALTQAEAAPHKAHVAAAGESDVAPPPGLWREPYSGSTGATGGIVSILGLIHDQFKSDLELATKEDLEDQAELEKFQTDCAADITTLSQKKADLEKEDADTASQMALDTENRKAAENQQAAALDYIKSIQPGCDFLINNFAVREKALVTERDGLEKALSVLSGSDFDKHYQDPSRDMKPLDAF